MRDDRLARRHKILVAGLIPYLALPIDLIPDFVPVAGQLDDAVLVAFVLRRLARATRVSSRALAGAVIIACAAAATRRRLGSGRCPVIGHLGDGQRILIVKLFSMTVAESPVARIVIR